MDRSFKKTIALIYATLSAEIQMLVVVPIAVKANQMSMVWSCMAKIKMDGRSTIIAVPTPIHILVHTIL